MTMSWRFGRELAGVALENGTSITYTYNTNGLRTCKNVGGTKTYYYYDDNNNLVGLTNDNATMFFYYDGNNSPASFSYNGTMYYYAKNLQGDIVGIIDKNGNSFVTYVYDSWGNISGEYGESALRELNPIRYRGYVYDSETGLYYLQDRYYDPIMVRFINVDNTAFDTLLSISLLGFRQPCFSKFLIAL